MPKNTKKRVFSLRGVYQGTKMQFFYIFLNFIVLMNQCKCLSSSFMIFWRKKMYFSFPLYVLIQITEFGALGPNFGVAETLLVQKLVRNISEPDTRHPKGWEKPSYILQRKMSKNTSFRRKMCVLWLNSGNKVVYNDLFYHK